ncbi:alpha/beta hydrolase [Oceanicella sp. SM1341]|uniref:alpha/beta hydrolase n=1 Tax=Oceanicella sp. SM1341 TaxID=1548889 RepID=UPI000E470D53|nr:alpha/beta hydrolase-fold protein [Oceanicella sp. SM1341]
MRQGPDTGGAAAPPETGAAGGGPAELPGSEVLPLAGPGGPMRLFLARPPGPPPPQGYALVLALDAAFTFGTLREAALLQSGGAAESGVAKVLVAALGYPTPDWQDMARRETDLTGPEAPPAAGRAATLTFLEHEVLPRIAARAPLDARRRMLLGHSFGGYFALRALADRPGLFSHVVASSPSVWVDPGAVSAGIAGLAAPGPGPVRVLVSVGDEEEAGVALARSGPAPDPARLARLRARHMVPRAREAAAALAARPGIDAAFHLFEAAGHGSVVAPMIARALRLLAGPPGD